MKNVFQYTCFYCGGMFPEYVNRYRPYIDNPTVQTMVIRCDAS
jgi:hypothetical protein